MRVIVSLLIASFVTIQAFSQEAPPMKRNALGVHVTFVETDDTAYGLTYSYDFTDHDRMFIQGETFDFDSSESTYTPDYISEWESETEGEELEIGYLRRVSDVGGPVGFFVGPSVGFQFDEGTFEGSESTTSGTLLYRGDIEYDTGINLYLNAMADYTFTSQFRLFSIFSFGYQMERDGELKYSTGDQPTIEFETDDDTFWNLAVGAGFVF